MLWKRQQEAEIITELLCSCSHRREDVAGCQSMYGESVNDPQSSWPVLRSGEGLLYAGLQHDTLFDDVAYVRHRAEGGVVLQCHPVRVVGNQAWIITGHLLI